MVDPENFLTKPFNNLNLSDYLKLCVYQADLIKATLSQKPNYERSLKALDLLN